MTRSFKNLFVLMEKLADGSAALARRAGRAGDGVSSRWMKTGYRGNVEGAWSTDVCKNAS